MFALIRADGTLAQIVHSLDGIDVSGLTVIEDVPEPVHEYEWDEATQGFLPRPAIRTYQRALDEAIDRIRGRYPAIGLYMAEEYRLTAAQAEAFAAAGYSGSVPLAVDSWVRASGMTAQQATDDILATKAMYEQMLLLTRDARLLGKAQIATATTSEQARAIYEAVLAQIEGQLPPPT